MEKGTKLHIINYCTRAEKKRHMILKFSLINLINVRAFLVRLRTCSSP